MSSPNSFVRRLSAASLFVLALAILAGCQKPVQQMESTERGVVFRRLPTFLGGGLSRSVVQGGAIRFVWPWDSLVRINTASKDIMLGEVGKVGDLTQALFTRAKDGNEVALQMVVRYRVRDDAAALIRLVQQGGKSNEEIERLVLTVSRAQIRRYLNDLRTSEFLSEADRYRGVDNVKSGIQKELNRLVPDAFDVLALMIERFEFARLKPDGTTDRSYQVKLNQILRTLEQTEREQLRIQTVKAEGEQREFQTQAQVYRLEQEALGIKQQAELRGAGYLTAKQNEAQGILALGKAHVEGLIDKIAALSGPGGVAVLKLDLAKQLEASGSQFVVLGDGGKGIEVQRTDTNDLIRQLGIIEAMREKKEPRPASVTQLPKLDFETRESAAREGISKEVGSRENASKELGASSAGTSNAGQPEAK